MKWVEALRIFNKNRGMWCIAKKGSPEYDEVKKIMNSSKPEAVAKRNEERKEKSTEQLKEVVSASEKRREEARRKYAEKIAEMEHHKKREESREIAIKKLRDVETETKSRNIKKKTEVVDYQKLYEDPLLLKMLGNPVKNKSSWDTFINNINAVKRGEVKELNKDDFLVPYNQNWTDKKVYAIFPNLKGNRYLDVSSSKTRKLIDGYEMRLIYGITKEGYGDRSKKSLVLIH